MFHRAWDLKPTQVHERFLYLGWDLREKRGEVCYIIVMVLKARLDQ